MSDPVLVGFLQDIINKANQALTYINGQVAPPVQPPVPPTPPITTPPPSLPPSGTWVLPWNITGNSRTFVTGVGAGPLTLSIVAPNTPGARHVVVTVASSDSVDTFHKWTVRDQTGAIVQVTHSQSLTLNLVVGDTYTVGSSGFGGTTWHGMVPGLPYTILVEQLNQDGTSSYMPPFRSNFLVDVNNTSNK